MKSILLLTTLIVLTLASCTKTNPETPPDPPQGPDTTKPAIHDTAYLRKSQLIYSYDAAGTTILDSSLTIWTYDNQRRPLLEVTVGYGAGRIDSTITTYNVNTKTERTLYYQGNMKYWDGTSVTYYNLSGNPDSLIRTTDYFDGSPSPQFFNLYYHYNALAQDTAEHGYTVVNNVKTDFFKTRLTYSGNFLDSNILYFDDTTNVADTRKYVTGNLVREVHYTNGVAWATIVFLHTNVPSGGFYGYIGDQQLLQSIVQEYPGSPADNRGDDFTYTFDASNRVSTVSESSGNILSQKYFLTYY